MTQFTTSRIKARELAKSTGGKVTDLNPPRKILALKNGKVIISDKQAPAKKSPRWLVS